MFKGVPTLSKKHLDFLRKVNEDEQQAIQDFDNHWTEEQRKKIDANRPPWLIGKALKEAHFSWLWRLKTAVMQRVSNFIAGRS